MGLQNKGPQTLQTSKPVSSTFSFYEGSSEVMCCGRPWMQVFNSTDYLPKWMHLLPGDQYIVVEEMSEGMNKDIKEIMDE